MLMFLLYLIFLQDPDGTRDQMKTVYLPTGGADNAIKALNVFQDHVCRCVCFSAPGSDFISYCSDWTSTSHQK